MFKSLLLSVHPKWCELIASGVKTVEVRKTRPKIEFPFKCYIYATMPKRYYKISKHLLASDENLCLLKGKVQMSDAFEFFGNCEQPIFLNGKVIGEFLCDNIEEIGFSPYNHGEYICSKQFYIEQSCLNFEEMFNYLGDGYGYGWHISNLVIYDTPKELNEFCVLKKCNSCFPFGYESTTCIFDDDCKVPVALTKPPQSWCYVEFMKVF